MDHRLEVEIYQAVENWPGRIDSRPVVSEILTEFLFWQRKDPKEITKIIKGLPDKHRQASLIFFKDSAINLLNLYGTRSDNTLSENAAILATAYNNAKLSSDEKLEAVLFKTLEDMIIAIKNNKVDLQKMIDSLSDEKSKKVYQRCYKKLLKAYEPPEAHLFNDQEFWIKTIMSAVIGPMIGIWIVAALAAIFDIHEPTPLWVAWLLLAIGAVIGSVMSWMRVP